MTQFPLQTSPPSPQKHTHTGVLKRLKGSGRQITSDVDVKLPDFYPLVASHLIDFISSVGTAQTPKITAKKTFKQEM